MKEEIKLPPLGDGIESGDVVKILVQKGDQIAKDSVLMELETEKAVVEFPSPMAGKIAEIHIQDGETVKVGQVLFSVETDAAEEKAEEKKEPEKKKEKKKPPPEEAPETTGEAEKKPPVRKEEEAKPAPEEKRPPRKEEKAGEEKKPEPPPEPGKPQGELVAAGPATRKLARELGIDLTRVRGTARGGRITVDDVKAHAKKLLESSRAGAPSPKIELPDFTQWGPVERKPLASLRAKVAENLGTAWPSVPLVTQFEEADITDLEQMRKKNVDYVDKKGGKLTLTVFVLKAVVAALKELPQFNASLDMERGELVYKQYYNIGVAVDTEAGLLVPVIKSADRKSFTEIAVELTQLAQKARERKLGLEELRGGNISISNLGGLGGTAFTPLVLPPDVAVVGLSRARRAPVWRNNTFEPRLIMPFCVSYDHRVIDGADGVRFARKITHELESFQELLLEG